MAVICDGHAMDHDDVLHALRDSGREKVSHEDKESNTMERLSDGQVQLGVGRYEQFAGSQRRIVNQMRTGTVSHHTLLLYVLSEDRSTYGYVSRVQG
jgi:hypothetical protein